MDFQIKKKRAIRQLVANLLMWGFVPVVIGGLSVLRSGLPMAPFPMAELVKLIEPSQLLTFLGAGSLYFLVLAFLRHKTEKKEEQERAVLFADHGFDEMASALYSFGSVLAICAGLGSISPLYLVATLVCYGSGYWLKPSESGANH